MNAPLDPRISAIPDVHGHAKGEHKPYAEERPIALSARMLFLWFYHACRRGWPRFLMVADHMNYLTFEDPAAVNLVRRALKLAQAGDLYGAADTASVDVGHAAVVSEGLRRGMRYSIGAEIDNDPRCRPDAQNIVDAMKPDGMIRSVHFLPIDHPTHGPNWLWPFDNPEFIEYYDAIGIERIWEIYMVTLLDAIERLPGHIIGHFYVPSKFGHWPSDEILEGHEDRFIEAVAAREMAVEFNSRYLYRTDDEAQREAHRRANVRLLRKAKAAGVGVAVGSDAHSPRDQGSAFDQILAVLDEAEINELVFPIGGRLARVALRVVRDSSEPAPSENEPEPATATDMSVTATADGDTSAEAVTGPSDGKAPRPKRRPAARKPKSNEPAATGTPEAIADEPQVELAAAEPQAAPSPDAPAVPLPAATEAEPAEGPPEPVLTGLAVPESTTPQTVEAAAPAITAANAAHEEASEPDANVAPGDEVFGRPPTADPWTEQAAGDVTSEPVPWVKPPKAVPAKRPTQPAAKTARAAVAKKETPVRAPAKKSPVKKSRPAAAPAARKAKPAAKKAAPKSAPAKRSAAKAGKKTAAKKSAKKTAPKRPR